MWTCCNQPVFSMSYGPAACVCKSLCASNGLQKTLTRASPVCSQRRDWQRALPRPGQPALCSTHVHARRASTALGTRWVPGPAMPLAGCDVTRTRSHPGLQQLRHFTTSHTDFLILDGKWHNPFPSSVCHKVA